MAYADNEDKIRGIKREPFVARRIKEQLVKKGLNVIMIQSSLLEDMRKKYDYRYKCPVNQFFDKNKKVQEIKVDIKCGKAFTLFDETGRNTLENSESTFIVFELYEGSRLLWINTGKFKDCLDKNGYGDLLKNSKYNNSKYFFIENYIRRYEYFLGKYVKYIN